jgi:2-hydroxychromene-2-carboxylate isomerase
MSHEVLVYFDYKSPYTFVGKGPAYALETDYGVRLTWLPYAIDLSEIADPQRAAHAMRKIRYLYLDARRFAKPQGLTIRGPERIFDSTPALIGMLFAQTHGKLRPYHDWVFERFFKRALDIENPVQIEALLREAGVPTEGFREYLAGEGRAKLERIRVEAEQRGIFGVPTFFLDGELFWGQDRLPLVRKRLEGHSA